jgi:hypothetical protein
MPERESLFVPPYLTDAWQLRFVEHWLEIGEPSQIRKIFGSGNHRQILKHLLVCP